MPLPLLALAGKTSKHINASVLWTCVEPRVYPWAPVGCLPLLSQSLSLSLFWQSRPEMQGDVPALRRCCRPEGGRRSLFWCTCRHSVHVNLLHRAWRACSACGPRRRSWPIHSPHTCVGFFPHIPLRVPCILFATCSCCFQQDATCSCCPLRCMKTLLAHRRDCCRLFSRFQHSRLFLRLCALLMVRHALNCHGKCTPSRQVSRQVSTIKAVFSCVFMEHSLQVFSPALPPPFSAHGPSTTFFQDPYCR